MSTTTEPRTVTVVVPMAPPACLSPNNRSRRGGHWEREAATRELREAACWGAVEICNDIAPHYPRFENTWTFHRPVAIHEHVIWPKSKGVLPDPDALPTYCKAALDGIVDAGIIASDSAKHVVSVTASQEKGTDAQGSIIITITDAATGGQECEDSAFSIPHMGGRRDMSALRNRVQNRGQRQAKRPHDATATGIFHRYI